MNVNDLFSPDPTRPTVGRPPDPYGWLIIDGGGLAVTAWATHRDLDRAEERVKAAVYVFITCLASLSRLVHDEAKVVVCWDGYDNRAWRRGYHPWYKHGRGSVIDRQEVRVVINKVGELLECIGAAQLKVDGREADDLVATVATDLSNDGETCLIFSDDKDFIQLISERVHLCRRSMQGIIMTPQQCDLLGIDWGERYLYVKAMAGDPGDNIKGLRGIGEKKAQQALDAVPNLMIDCQEEPDLADWDDLPRTVRRAFVRAGRKLVGPLTLDLSFAKAFAKERDLFPPQAHEVSEQAALRAAGIEMVRCLRLVELDDTMDLEWMYPDVNLERIPTVLAQLDMAHETDLLSSIYALARMRNPNATPPRTPAMRSGAAFDEAPIADAF